MKCSLFCPLLYWLSVHTLLICIVGAIYSVCVWGGGGWGERKYEFGAQMNMPASVYDRDRKCFI